MLDNALLKLKHILNGFTDEELKDCDLWIDTENKIDAIVVDGANITLLTDIENLKYKEKMW